MDKRPSAIEPWQRELDRRRLIYTTFFAGLGGTALAGFARAAAAAPLGGAATHAARDTVRITIPGEVRGLAPSLADAAAYVPSLQAIAACYDTLVSFVLP